MSFLSGMGEVIAVMNGVEFRTRHNDYKLVMPSTTSKEYHATEKIPFPKIPDEVLQKATVDVRTLTHTNTYNVKMLLIIDCMYSMYRAST